ncbi:MAG: response regulator transcription factor [Ilumatobacteraceae bacterium]
MTRLLIVEDDPSLRRSLTLNLRARGYTVEETGNGEDALVMAGRLVPDVILLDLGLPGISGLDVVRGIREWSQLPILVLSARGAERDKVEALDAGANDYVTKPFGIEELLARLRVAERSIAGRRPPRTLELAGRTIDLDRRDVRAADGSPIRLTPIEWALLQHLADAEGRVVGQTELLRAVWGPSYTTETNYLRVHVTHLRKKLEHDPAHPVHLLTEPGIGYRLSC